MSTSQTSRVATLGHALVAVLFVAMAALQLNDPDPLLWFVVYLAIATMPAARIFGYKLPTLFWGTVGMAIACLLASANGFVDYVYSGDWGSVGEEMSAEKPYIEPAREFLGVAIGAVCLFFYRAWHRRPSDA
ncbi:MAG: transmembrane 220 family protein [Bacteroidota bacterium]